MEKDSKQLPPGTWLYIRSLPIETTEETLSQFLWEHGMDVPPEAISLKPSERRADEQSAIISVPNATLLALVVWVVNNDKLHGWPVLPQLMPHKKRPRAA